MHDKKYSPISDSGAYFGHWKNHCQPIADDVIDAEKTTCTAYKCGPDYIDTKYHEKACGIPSYNLDLFMASEHHVCKYIIIMQ